MMESKQPTADSSPSRAAAEHSELVDATQADAPLPVFRLRDVAISIGFGAVGWALCGTVIWIGTRFASINTTLIIHAAAVPVIFGSLSWLQFRRFGATRPLQTAFIFLSVVVALDLFVVSLLIAGNFDMFTSIIGTWVPFALLFLSTYVCGAFERAGRPTDASGMIEAVSTADRIRRAYNLFSYGYGRVVSPLEHKPRMLGLERAALQPDDRVLEVAVGPGHSFVEILKRVAADNTVCGVDLSPKMLEKTRRRAKAAGCANIDLREADARRLPFAADTFDVVYNSYMLDLIPLNDMPVVLGEFRRVLKPHGRLVLVNMSKNDADKRTWLERLYQLLPAASVPYLLGGCRPVLMEQRVIDSGFVEVSREFISHVIPSEVVTATKPAAESEPSRNESP